LADPRSGPHRIGILLALLVVSLLEVVSLLQGVRSVRRLRARVTHDAEQQVRAARPRLEQALSAGGRRSWEDAASIAIDLDLATEVDVLDGEGRTLFSRPDAAPVLHQPGPEERRRLLASHGLTTVAQEGPALRVLTYLPVPSAGPGVLLRLAATAPDLEAEMAERRQVFLGHLVALGALAVAALLVLLQRQSTQGVPATAALQVYEEAMERLRDRGEEREARHERERRRMEETLREREALARAGELTAGIVHEVRNGLGTIVGYARLLERSGLPENGVAAAGSIRQECETLEVVVRRFSDFVRLEKLNLARTDLSSLLVRVGARERRAHEDVEVSFEGLEPPLGLSADEELLERAFENVLRNAIEAAESGGGHVRVVGREGASATVVSIEDDGPGLAADHPGEIRPFYTTRPGGLGLGLPLARKIVLLHGGTLRLEQPDTGGLRVVIGLPLEPVEI
jgi:signal transduction histidine kinase